MNKLHDAATEALAALRRVRPQVRGVLPEQDCDSAIRALEDALADYRTTWTAESPNKQEAMT